MVHRKLLLGGISLLVLASPFAATAQTASAVPAKAKSPTIAAERQTDQEIIVTANRREESILKVPVSVTAYSQENIDLKGIRNIEDLARMTPGVSINQGTFGIKYLVIRGLTSSVGATMNGVYIDDTPIQVRSVSLTSNFYPAMFDLERVEVLRGPQGTLFGAGAMGGAIRFISAKPSVTDFSGYSRAEVGFTEGGAPSYEGGAAVGGPIIKDKVGFRVSGYYRRDGGYIDRVPFVANRGTAKDNHNSRETFVGQAALTLKPTEDLTITPSVFHQQANRNNSDQFWDWRPGVKRAPLPEFTSGEGLESYGKDNATIYSVKGELDLGPATLISNTAFTDRKIASFDDGTALFLDIFGQPQSGGLFETAFGIDFRSSLDVKMRQQAFTQELRVQSNPGEGRFSYVAGVFFQNSRQTAEEFDRSVNPKGLAGLIPLAPAVNGNIGYLLDNAKDRQIAAFGQLDYKLTDKLSVSAGLRYSRVTFDFRQVSGNNLPTDEITTGRTSESPITPKFGIEYNPTNRLMFYGSAGKGFRPGGTNTIPSPASITPECTAALQGLGYATVPGQYRSDSTWAYELGAKGRVGSWLTFAGDAFQIDWTDVQRTRSVLNCANPFIDNLGKSRARGVEAKIVVSPLKGLSLDANLSYTDATVQQTLIRPATVVGGVLLPAAPITTKGNRFAPPWIISLAADYETELGSGNIVGYGHVQWDHRSGLSAATGNLGYNPLLARVATQDFVAARFGVRTGGIDISVFVNNVLNSRDELGRLALGAGGAERLLRQTYRPRTIGLTGSHRF